MTLHQKMGFVDKSGKTLQLDLCCFCSRMKSLSEHGRCPYFETDYIGKNCPGIVQVPDVGQRLMNLIEEKYATSAERNE